MNKPLFLKHRVNSLTEMLGCIENGEDGIELDLRLWDGDLVVSHDSTTEGTLLVQFIHQLRVSQKLRTAGKKFVVAINIKENGLAPYIAANTRSFPAWVEVYYFDVPAMEIPAYHAAGLAVYGRASRYDNQLGDLRLLAGIQVDIAGMSDGAIMQLARSVNTTTLPVSLISKTLLGGDADYVSDLTRFKNLKYVITKKTGVTV